LSGGAKALSVITFDSMVDQAAVEEVRKAIDADVLRAIDIIAN
jgi:hypothetical protein